MSKAMTTSDRAATHDRSDCGGAASQDLVWSAPLAVASIAHEIRNPLLSVSANLELLVAQLDAHDPRRRCVDRALVEVDRLSAIVDRLVDFAATHRPNLQRTRWVSFLRDAADRERERVAHEGMERWPIELRTDRTCEACMVDLDPQLLRRVVANLVRNCVEAMPDGGRIVIETKAERTAAAAATATATAASTAAGSAAEGAEIVVRFDDEGAGVPVGMGMRIFEPFVTTKPCGSGLGLPFSRRIARVHGGDLRAVERRGGRFELRLPIAELRPFGAEETR